MDEDDDLPNLRNPSKQLEEPNKLGNEELTSTEQYLMAPNSFETQGIPDVLHVGKQNEEPTSPEGLLMRYVGDRAETNLLADDPDDKESISGKGLPLGNVTNQRETGFLVTELTDGDSIPEDEFPMGLVENQTGADFFEVGHNDRDAIVGEGLPMGCMVNHRKANFLEPERTDAEPRYEENLLMDYMLNNSDADLLAPEPYGDKDGILMGYMEDHMEANFLAADPKAEKSIAEKVLPMEYLGNHSETNLVLPEQKNSVGRVVIAMEDGLMPRETASQVAKPNDEKPIAVQGLPMAYTESYMNVPVRADLKDENLIAENAPPMEYADIHSQLEAMVSESEQKIEEPVSMINTVMQRESDVPSDVPKDDIPNDMHVHKMVDTAIHMERDVPVAGEQKEEKQIIQENLQSAEADVLYEPYVPAAEPKAEEPMVEDGLPFLCTEETKLVSGVLEGLTNDDTEADDAEVETDNGALEVDSETDVGEAETEVTDMESKAAEVDTEMAKVDTEMAAYGESSGGKRKSASKAFTRVSQKKKIEEDVCFICFDGGELVICDRRGCPKAYHPSCVNRDEAFFKAKGRWNCGWHICSTCQKNSYYTCYTCTYSLCKGCIKDGVLSCVRGNKGFCDTCLRTILLIENNEQGNNEMGQVDFDDKNCWEYLFKDYWTDLNGSLCLTLDELTQAKNPWKASNNITSNEVLPRDSQNADSVAEQSEKQKIVKPKKRKKKRLSKSSPSEAGLPDVGTSSEWASKELVELVIHMKNGDGSILSQFDVQALLLDYIKKNNLRDPRKKSQIICDSRLQNLFGKTRVGHFEMLKLLESHFLIKRDSQADSLQGHVVDTDATSQIDMDGNVDSVTKSSKDRKRKTRKKGYRVRQSNLDDYAAIDLHNINLIYLRRNLMEDLIGDVEKFHDKVMNSFVRIRISGTGQKQDIYRLVQVVGTCKAARPYKVGKRTTDLMLDILNLNKIEVISIDIISNQDFSEDECMRLRQSIRCGLINRITVGELLEKVEALHAVRINDWMETEITRLSHLRDRASEKGRQKELRECVEKLQILKTPEEKQRKLEEIPEVHADRKMDPSYESEEDREEANKTQEKSHGHGFGRGVREPISPGAPSRRSSNKNMELSRNLSDLKDHSSNKNMELSRSLSDIKDHPKNKDVRMNEEQQSINQNQQKQNAAAATNSAIMAKTNETDKVWHYKDPSGKVQGPFSMVQLRKWNNTGYFPTDLRIWITNGIQEESLLLADALLHVFPKEQHPSSSQNSSIPSAPRSSSAKLQNTKFEQESAPLMAQASERKQSQIPQIEDSFSRGAGGVSMHPNPAPSDAKSVSTDQFVQQNPNSGWAPAPVTPIQQQQQGGYGQWVNTNQNQVPAGGFPAGGFPPWRPPQANQLESGSNFQAWNMGLMPENQNAAQNLRPENPTAAASWAPVSGNANMGWVGPPPANPNVNWAGAGGSNVSWGPNPQGGPPPMAQDGSNMNWAAPGISNPNPNMNWAGQGQGNPGWVAPSSNSNMWGNNHGQNGNRAQGRPSWNRNGGRGMNRANDGVCKYYENGRCNRGASCNFFHPQGS